MTDSIGAPHTRQVQFMVVGPRLEPVTAGKHRMGIMSPVKHEAREPMIKLNLPRCHGPRRKRLPTKKVRMKMGMVKATKAAMAAMLKIAPIATLPPKMSRVRQIPMTVLNQTALTGVLV